MTAFQSLIPNNGCYGCGPGNEHGLRIKSHWIGDDVSQCTYRPTPHQCAGPSQFLNGGIIATLIDCHSVCTAIAKAYQLAGREIGQGPEIWYVTGNINVSYKRPVPIDDDVILKATIVDVTEKKTVLNCELLSNNTLCAQGEVVAIRVPGDWKDEKR